MSGTSRRRGFAPHLSVDAQNGAQRRAVPRSRQYFIRIHKAPRCCSGEFFESFGKIKPVRKTGQLRRPFNRASSRQKLLCVFYPYFVAVRRRRHIKALFEYFFKVRNAGRRNFCKLGHGRVSVVILLDIGKGVCNAADPAIRILFFDFFGGKNTDELQYIADAVRNMGKTAFHIASIRVGEKRIILLRKTSVRFCGSIKKRDPFFSVKDRKIDLVLFGIGRHQIIRIRSSVRTVYGVPRCAVDSERVGFKNVSAVRIKNKSVARSARLDKFLCDMSSVQHAV